MKKMLVIMMHLKMGGAEKSLVNLLNEIDKEKYQVDLLLLKRTGDLLEQVPESVNVLETPFELKCFFSNQIYGVAGFPFWLCRMIALAVSKGVCKIKSYDEAYIRWNKFYKRFVPEIEDEYDIAMSYLPGPSMFYLVDKVRTQKKITWIHNDYKVSGTKPDVDRIFFDKVDRLVTISNRCVESLQNSFPKYIDKIVYIQNVTSSALIKKQALDFVPEEYTNNKPVILSIGRLSNQKGFDLAIDAAYYLKQKHVNFHWFIIGEGELKSQLQRMISVKDVSDCVTLLGIRKNPYPYIMNATIVVQPSRFEGKSVVMDEAKILAKPIIATNYSTVKDQLSDSEGLIVDMDAQSIANGIEKLLINENILTAYSEYLKQFDYGNTEELSKLYRLL